MEMAETIKKVILSIFAVGSALGGLCGMRTRAHARIHALAPVRANTHTHTPHQNGFSVLLVLDAQITLRREKPQKQDAHKIQAVTL